MAQKNKTNAELAKELSKEILDDLEIHQTPISKILLKTKRLSRLLFDSEIQSWIDLEIAGYPASFKPNDLGACQKYFVQPIKWGKKDDESNQRIISLPALESLIEDIGKMTKACEIDLSFSSFLRLSDNYHQRKMQIHNYVIDVFLSLSVGEIAENIFQEMRIMVDTFLQENCSKEVKQKLVSIDERLKENNPEAYAQALLSCRRILTSIADSVFPAQNEKYIDKKGNSREVGAPQYINRILAFIDQNVPINTNSRLITSNIDHLAARLDAINEESNKGVHDVITKEEARLTILQMYIIIAEIARIKKGGVVKKESPKVDNIADLLSS